MKSGCLKARHLFSSLIFLLCVLGARESSAQTLEKVFITATNAEAVTDTLFWYGIDRGLFRKEGIDLEYRLLPPNLALAAMVAREVDYASTVGSPFRAAVRGFPVKVIAIGLDKPFFYIMVQPGIQSPGDLKGKKFAVSSLEGTAARTAKLGLRALGLNPDKDVTFIVVGSAATRLLAMEVGSVHATVVPSPHNIRLRQKGFKELVFAGQLISEPFVGVAAASEKIDRNPSQVKKVLKGFLRSFKAVKSERKDTVEFIARRFNLEPDVAAEVYETILQSSTKDGTLDQQVLKDYLKIVKEETRVEKEVALSDIVDFRLLYEASREIEK